LRVFNEVAGCHRSITYYATPSGAEIDFVIGARLESPPHVVCIEVKLAKKWDRSWERAMRDLKSRPGITVDRMIGVYTGPRAYHYDALHVLPIEEFLRELHEGKVFV
jgi:hypothetical protein